MTIYGWDRSHYDGTLTLAKARQALTEGIQFLTSKCGEGLTNDDGTDATSLANARDAGIPVLGGYWFNHGNDKPADEVTAFLKDVNRDEPWWKDFPAWFWQADLETSPSGLPSAAWAKEFCDRLRDQTGRVVIAYASHGMYGDKLAGLGHPLWNANYPSSKKAAFKSLYPGDSFAGWTKYSGQVPALCQYTSSATIAGLTTCDANAFRGSLDDLLTLIGADMAISWDDQVVDSGDPSNPQWSVDGTLKWLVANMRTVLTTTVADAKVDTASAAAVTALTTLIKSAGGDADSAAIIAAMNTAIAAEGVKESATVAALSNQVAKLQADLVAAAQASAAAMAK